MARSELSHSVLSLDGHSNGLATPTNSFSYTVYKWRGYWIQSFKSIQQYSLWSVEIYVFGQTCMVFFSQVSQFFILFISDQFWAVTYPRILPKIVRMLLWQATYNDYSYRHRVMTIAWLHPACIYLLASEICWLATNRISFKIHQCTFEYLTRIVYF